MQILTDLQREIVALAAGASDDDQYDHTSTERWTELQAATYIAGRMNILLKDEGLTVTIWFNTDYFEMGREC